MMFEQLIADIATKFSNLPAAALDDEIHRTLQTLGASLEADRSYIFLLSDDGARLTCAYQWEAPFVVAAGYALPDIMTETHVACQILRGETLALGCIIDSASVAMLAGIQSAIFVPLISRAVVIGFIGADIVHRPIWWSASQVALLTAVGAAIAAALELRRVQQMLEQANQMVESRVETRTREIDRRYQVAEGLREIVVSLNAGHPLDKTLDHIVAHADVLMGAHGCALYQWDKDNRCVFIEASSGLVPGIVSSRTLPDDVIEVLGYNTSVDCPSPDYVSYVIPDVKASSMSAVVHNKTFSPELRGWCAATIDHYRTLLTIPLMIADEIYGILVFYYCEFTQLPYEDIRLGVTFGNQTVLAIENARLRVQAEQAAVLQERSRLARDLHDSVTQSLYSLTLLAEAGRRLAKTGDVSRVREVIARLGSIAQQALKEMRLLVYELRPLALKRVGLVGALQHRLDTVEKRAGVEASLLVEGEVVLPVYLEEELYHIVQEALNNALKHAEATAVKVHIVAVAGHIDIEIVDNGVGFDPVKVDTEGGIGLSSMRERAEKQGGILVVQSAPGEGARVSVSI